MCLSLLEHDICFFLPQMQRKHTHTTRLNDAKGIEKSAHLDNLRGTHRKTPSSQLVTWRALHPGRPIEHDICWKPISWLCIILSCDYHSILLTDYNSQASLSSNPIRKLENWKTSLSSTPLVGTFCRLRGQVAIPFLAWMTLEALVNSPFNYGVSYLRFHLFSPPLRMALSLSSI